MSESNFLIVKPDLRFQSAPETDMSINADLVQTQSEVIQYDRTVNVNLATLFDDERQKSTTFRPTLKFSYLYEKINS